MSSDLLETFRLTTESQHIYFEGAESEAPEEQQEPSQRFAPVAHGPQLQHGRPDAEGIQEGG